MKKVKMLFLSGFLLLGTFACAETARTSADAPETTGETVEAPDVETAQETQEDSTSEVRRNQLDADIRAREERNNLTGGDADRTDGDLQSEVRSKLEANLPASQLAVEAEDGVVTVVGTVPTQEQYERIEPLSREIKGVQDVTVDVTVVPAQPEG
ncbi:MAG: BON domain-containing protein [Cyanobacteria bacterium RM1_2_2]|nr:BON domain-containing protein [Cyanobacteria bacterium RM1_2_2]